MTDMTDAEAKALCDELGIATKTAVIDGQTVTVINEEGMRKLAGHAPIGAPAAHAKVDQMFAAVREATRTTTPPAKGVDDFSVAEWQRMAYVLGVDIEVTTDTFGRPDVRLDRKAMRAFRDAALRNGFADIASTFTKALKGEK
ncbi:hypothetical protein ACIQH0_13290 [Streptomyces griseus]|uniref:hypothetical protein n=1 Tax=Streptomyces griseus TaxID=1911 RepID=UPI0038076394